MASSSPTAEPREALAAAVVEADADDPRSVQEVKAALEAARRAGALPTALAEELAELQAELDRDPGEALRRLAELLGDGQGAPAATPPLAGAASADRDAETIELVGDFLEEGNEGLARADEMLLAIEKNGPDSDKTHALFRVFHTIKGVAGFLELAEIVSLAHITETLLNQVREGKQALSGVAFEVVFESTAALRRLLDSLRKAVDARAPLLPDPEVPALVGRIQAAIVPEGDDARGQQPGFVVKKTASYAVRKEIAAVPPPRSAPAAAAPAAAPPAAPQAPTPSSTAAAQAPAPPEPGSAGPAAPGEGGAPPAPGSQIRDTVKVDLERVDSMVEMIGELIIVESMVIHAPEIVGAGSLRLRNYLNQLSKISRDLQNVAMRMRMVPVRGAFQKMARLVRDLSRKTGKDIVLEQVGEDTEMDRSMVERIEDPLVHLVRNSVDHGIEGSAERVSSGKAARAVVRLAAYHEGGSIVVELTDDGRGLNREKILKKAREKGLVEEGKDLTDAEVHALIFLPGFSTAAQVTEISGRGVGMDVVKRNIEGMRGRVTVSSRPGQGTTFRMVLPLTLAIIDGMLVACGTEKYIIPSLSIVESLRPTEDMVSRAAGRGEIINVRGEILPLLRLHHLLEMQDAERPFTEAHVVVVEGMGRKVGLVVDDVITQQQVVIKPLGSGLGDTDFLSGAAILSDGKVGLILNVDRLAVLASRGGGRARDGMAATG
jgi:two-component system chemotaxis sensor kinase CheA